MSLSDQMLKDAISVFCNPQDFAEPVVYTPAGGLPVTINAIVDRNPPVRIDGGGNAWQPKVEISVPNDADAGISSSDPNFAAGTITLPLNLGETPIPLVIRAHRMQTQDAGILHLMLI